MRTSEETANSRRNGAISRIRMIPAVLAAGGLALSATAAMAAPRFADIFSDHAVLQREKLLRVWGKAAPGANVTVRLSNGKSFRAKADADGRWAGAFAPSPAGGPYVMTADDGAGVARLEDLLIGDVFVCSGQSNMEFPLKFATGSWGQIDRLPTIDRLRFVHIAQDGAPAPLDHFRHEATWRTGGPAAADFSAVCYDFGKDLAATKKIPIGLIGAYWGGTIIEAWTSAEKLAEFDQYKAGLETLALYQRDPAAARRLWDAKTDDAWAASGGKTAIDKAFTTAEFDDKAWGELKAGTPWEDAGVADLSAFDGVVWLRGHVRLTAKEAQQAAKLYLGDIDDADETWINGVKLGRTIGWQTSRVYDAPQGALRAGDNVIAIRVVDTGGGGGLWENATKRRIEFADGAVALPVTWKYQIGGPVPPNFIEITNQPWDAPNGLSVLYNAMIAPMAGLSVKAVAWYQGESNTGTPETYQALLAGFFADWRARFKDPALPFLVAQISAFGPTASAPVASKWAALRDAERRAVADDAHAALAATIDVGDPIDVHPTQKLVAARRLVRGAENVVYGGNAPSGPTPADAIRRGGDIIVRFSGVSGALAALSADSAIGFEVCSASACRYAAAKPYGATVILPGANAADIVKIRYAWADAPLVNLFDHDMQTPPTFEIAVGP